KGRRRTRIWQGTFRQTTYSAQSLSFTAFVKASHERPRQLYRRKNKEVGVWVRSIKMPSLMGFRIQLIDHRGGSRCLPGRESILPGNSGNRPESDQLLRVGKNPDLHQVSHNLKRRLAE